MMIPTTRETFVHFLQEIDPKIKVIEASNGIETIGILESGEVPDMIFLDINMPFLDGEQALVEIRKDKRLNNTRVVMYSTNINRKSIPAYISLNAQYLTKPLTLKDGLRILRHIIRPVDGRVSISAS